MLRNLMTLMVFASLFIWPDQFWKMAAVAALYYASDIADSLAVIKKRSRYAG